jgi:predicted metal-dependent enzyme (double-stranded beta helix superfamily)
VTTETEGHNYTVADFIEDVRAMLGALGPTDGALEQAARLLRHLSTRDDLYPDADHAALSESHRRALLHADPDGSLTLALVPIPAAGPERVHTPQSWGVVCGYAGVAVYVTWERRGDGGRAGYAGIAEVERKELRRGQAAWWPDAPDAIHSLRAGADTTAWVLVLSGPATPGRARLHFDPATGSVRVV